jgi:hypothetical protein
MLCVGDRLVLVDCALFGPDGELSTGTMKDG